MKIPVVIHACWNNYEKRFDFDPWGHDMSSVGYTPCAELSVEFEPPAYADLVAGTVKILKAEQDSIRAESQAKVTALQQRIDELLCIEHKPDAAAEVAQTEP